MASTVEVTGLKGEAALAAPHLVRVVFQLSAVPAPEWVTSFKALARELALTQNRGIRPGFRFSYRLDADTVQVSCPTASFTTPINGKNTVAQTIIDLVANANRAADKTAALRD